MKLYRKDTGALSRRIARTVVKAIIADDKKKVRMMDRKVGV